MCLCTRVMQANTVFTFQQCTQYYKNKTNQPNKKQQLFNLMLSLAVYEMTLQTGKVPVLTLISNVFQIQSSQPLKSMYVYTAYCQIIF